MSSHEASRQIVATHSISGRSYEVTRITWKDSEGLSYDVCDSATRVSINNESWDDKPTFDEILNTLDSLATDIAEDDLDDFFDAAELLAVIGPVWRVTYAIHSTMDTGGAPVHSGDLIIRASDESSARAETITHVHEYNTMADARIDPIVNIVNIEEVTA